MRRTRSRIGSGSFLTAFFSTVAVRAEDGRWGSRYPILMRELYHGRVEPERLSELSTEIAPTITSLADYWWTSDGKDFVKVLGEAVVAARSAGEPLTIE